eukprot:17931-Heterococcus_DN1.PRE.3
MPVRDTITAPYTGACRVCDLHAVVHAVPGGVHVERCRFLEETNCKGLCTNMCKLPTEKFFRETLGLDMTMKPDYDTFECKLSLHTSACAYSVQVVLASLVNCMYNYSLDSCCCCAAYIATKLLFANASSVRHHSVQYNALIIVRASSTKELEVQVDYTASHEIWCSTAAMMRRVFHCCEITSLQQRHTSALPLCSVVSAQQQQQVVAVLQ